jgi:transcriptional regulator with XRE-family HTH domain
MELVMDYLAPPHLPVDGSRLAAYRKAAGLTQVDVAKGAGVTCRTIRRLEAGYGVKARGVTIRRLAAVLAVDAIYLLALDGPEVDA